MQSNSDFDVLIKNGTVVDGTGRGRFRADIGIKGSRVEAIGRLESSNAQEIIDAAGLIVSPGFIDVHTHADTMLIHYPEASNYVYQGVTTVIGGNCGYSPAPLNKYWLFDEWEYDWWHKIKPYRWHKPVMHSLKDVNKIMDEKYGWMIDWRTLGEFFKRLEEKGISINYAAFVGHNTIRTAVMGTDYKREAKKSEIRDMKKLVREAMEDGALGLSSGLLYEPGIYASTNELVELVKIVKEYDGIYVTHIRETSPHERDKALREAIKIGKCTKIPVHISHIFPVYFYPTVRPDALTESAQKILKIIEEAKESGISVTFDLIPNVSGGLFIIPYLSSLITPWIVKFGSLKKLGNALVRRETRRKIKLSIIKGKEPYFNPKQNPQWAKTIKILKTEIKDYEGRTLEEVSKGDPIETFLDIIQQDPKARFEFIYKNESEIKILIKHELVMIGSDTFPMDNKWCINYPPFFLPHMNNYGAFSRFIRRYVKEYRFLTLEEAVKKITYFPAKRFNLEGRGIIQRGAYADIVTFDYRRIADRGTYLEPRRYADGIKWILVNGKIVLRNTQHTHLKPGKILRRKTAS